MASNPVDSVIVKFELDVSGVKKQLAAVSKDIQAHFKNLKPQLISVAINQNSLRTVHAQIKAATNIGKLSVGLNQSNVRTVQSQLRAATKIPAIPVHLNQSTLNRAKAQLAGLGVGGVGAGGAGGAGGAATAVATTAAVNTNVTKAATSAKQLAGHLNLSRSNAELLASSIFTVRNVLAAVSTLGVFRAFREIVAASATFESAMIDVAKTAGFSDRQVASLSLSIKDMGNTLPITTEELLSIAKAAGQVGVTGVQNVAKFTKALAMLSLATDVNGEEGARAVAQVLNLTKTAPADADRFAASLVTLGNVAAATEKEILNVATKVAQSVAIFGVSSKAILALSTVMREMGVEAELGGTQIGLLFQALNLASNAQSGTPHDTLEKLGIDLKELRLQLRTHPEQALLTFLDAMSKLDSTQVGTALAQIGFEGARMPRVLTPLIQNVVLMKLRLDQSSKAWEENSAAMVEVERQSTTFAGRMTMVKNQLTEVVRQLGDDLNPALAATAEWIAKIATSDIGQTTNALKAMAAATAAFGIVKGPVFITDIAMGLTRLRLLRNEQRKLILESKELGNGLGAILIRLGTKYSIFAGVAAAAIAALVGVTYFVAGKVADHFNKMADAPEALTAWDVVKTTMTSLRDQAEEDMPAVAAMWKAAREEIERQVTPGNTSTGPDGGKYKKQLTLSDALSADLTDAKNAGIAFGNAFVEGGIYALQSVAGMFQQVSKDVVIAGQQIKSVVPESIKGIFQSSTQADKSINSLNRGLGETSLILRSIEDGIAGNSDLSDRFDVISDSLERLAQKRAAQEGMEPLFSTEAVDRAVEAFEGYSDKLVTFNLDIAKARVAVDEMKYSFDNSGTALGRFKSGFADFLQSRGLDSLALAARSADAAMVGYTEALSGAEEAQNTLRELLKTTSDPKQQDAIKSQIATQEEILRQHKVEIHSAQELIDTNAALEASYKNLFTQKLLTENREAIEAYEIASNELANSVLEVDIPALQAYYKEFGFLVDVIPGLDKAFRDMATNSLRRDLFLDYLKDVRSSSFETLKLTMRLQSMNSMGAKSGSAWSEFLAGFAKTPEALDAIYNSVDRLHEIRRQFEGFQAAMADITIEEKLSELRDEIAGITLSNADMAAALEISTATYASLSDEVGGINGEFARFILSLGLSGEEVERLRGRMYELKEAFDAAKEAALFAELGQAIGSSFTNFGDEITDAFLQGTASMESFKESFKSFAQSIIREMMRIFVWKRIAGLIETAVGAAGGAGAGGSSVFEPNDFGGGSFTRAAKGRVFAFAKGGTPTNTLSGHRNRVTNRPTMAPMALFGEAGPEAIMPLKRAGGVLGVIDAATGGTVPLTRNSSGVLGINSRKGFGGGGTAPTIDASAALSNYTSATGKTNVRRNFKQAVSGAGQIRNALMEKYGFDKSMFSGLQNRMGRSIGGNRRHYEGAFANIHNMYGHGRGFMSYVDPKTGKTIYIDRGADYFTRRLGSTGSLADRNRFLARVQALDAAGDRAGLLRLMSVSGAPQYTGASGSGIMFRPTSTKAAPYTPTNQTFAKGGVFGGSVSSFASGAAFAGSAAASSVTPFANGGAFSAPPVTAFAAGGISAGPSAQRLASSGGNNYTVGGAQIYIDARGSNGDAAVEAAIERGIRRAAPSLVNAAASKVRDDRMRSPNSARR